MKYGDARWAYDSARTREELVAVWEEHIRGLRTLTNGAEYLVPTQIARLNAERRAENASEAMVALIRRNEEYRNVILDLLDTIDAAADMDSLLAALDEFEVEEKENKMVPLAMWREGMLRREEVKTS